MTKGRKENKRKMEREKEKKEEGMCSFEPWGHRRF